MHEIGLMQQALGAVFARLDELDAQKVLAIRMRIGPLSGVVPEALEFAFSSLTPGTPAEGARLEIEHEPVCCWCRDCENEFEMKDWNYTCSSCGGTNIEIRRGTEMEVASMEVA